VNVWTQFKKLLPSQALLAGEVTAHNADGTSTVELPDGSQIRALGTGVAIGSSAFVRGGEIVGAAPTLPTYDATV
jgi:hypothetical protein